MMINITKTYSPLFIAALMMSLALPNCILAQSINAVDFPSGKQFGINDTIWIYPKVETPNSIAVFDNYSINADTIVVNLKHCISALDFNGVVTLNVKIPPLLQGKYKVKINLKSFNSIWNPNCTIEFERHIWYDSIEVDAKFTDVNSEKPDGQTLAIFPNPVKNRFQIAINKHIQLSQVLIFNIMGQRVYEAKQTNAEIDISFLPFGLYFVSFFDFENRKYTGKFIKE